MSRTFSPAKLFRMTHKNFLKQFFVACGLADLPVDWGAVKRRDVQPLLNAVGGLGHEQSIEVEGHLEDVFDLADGAGTNAIVEAGLATADALIVGQLPAEGGPYDKAMWAWLNRRDLIAPALRIHRVETASWWRRRDDLAVRIWPFAGPDATAKLEQAVSQILLTDQGRGRHCTVEQLTRGRAVYFFAYADDHVQNAMEHDGTGTLRSARRRSAFEIVFAYAPEQGTLEVCAAGVPPRTKRKLEEAFARELLGQFLGPWAPPAYELKRLLAPDFDLATEPADGVTARLRALRLRVPNSAERILLESEVGPGPGLIRARVAHFVNEHAVALQDADVDLARFHFAFAAAAGGREGSLTFDVVAPNSCNLRGQREERVRVILRYLRLWELLRERTSARAA
jgi:hypothetical protein